MPASKPTKVYYIPGRFLPGYRLEDHEAESAEAANELVKTGLFALSEKDANAAAFSTPEATVATEDNVKKRPEPAAPAPLASEPAEE